MMAAGRDCLVAWCGADHGGVGEPAFTQYFAAQLITSAGTYASAIAPSFGDLDVSGPNALGLIFLAREIPMIVLLRAGGVFPDRWPWRAVLAGSRSCRR